MFVRHADTCRLPNKRPKCHGVCSEHAAGWMPLGVDASGSCCSSVDCMQQSLAHVCSSSMVDPAMHKHQDSSWPACCCAHGVSSQPGASLAGQLETHACLIAVICMSRDAALSCRAQPPQRHPRTQSAVLLLSWRYMHRFCLALLLQGLANMEAPRSSGRQRKQVETFTYDNDHLTRKNKALQVRTFSPFLHGRTCGV